MNLQLLKNSSPVYLPLPHALTDRQCETLIDIFDRGYQAEPGVGNPHKKSTLPHLMWALGREMGETA